MTETSRRSAAIVGWCHSPFGKLDIPDIEGLIGTVAEGALDDAGVSAAEIDFVSVGVLNCGFSKQGFEAGLVIVVLAIVLDRMLRRGPR